jgi:hypothetical protein
MSDLRQTLIHYPGADAPERKIAHDYRPVFVVSPLPAVDRSPVVDRYLLGIPEFMRTIAPIPGWIYTITAICD